MTGEKGAEVAMRFQREKERRDGGLTPREAETREVLSFVTASLPPGTSTVLEVGCGQGALAAGLQARGFRVEAIDLDPEAVASARSRGVSARCSSLFDIADGRYDAVLFTLSLHHISPLDAAVAKARTLLTPGGVLVVDEFAHDEVDAASATWFQGVQDLLQQTGALTAHAPGHAHHQPRDGNGMPPPPALTGTLGTRVPGYAHPHPRGGHAPPPASQLEIWKGRYAHEPPIHGGLALRQALGGALDVLRVERGPHFHRMLARRLPPDDRGARLLEGVRVLEDACIAAGLIIPLGLRVVARRAP